MDDKIIDFSEYKELKNTTRENEAFKEMYYGLARAVENAIKCDSKRESDKCLVVAQRLAEYTYLSSVDGDIESVDVFMAGFDVDEYLDQLDRTKKENNE